MLDREGVDGRETAGNEPTIGGLEMQSEREAPALATLSCVAPDDVPKIWPHISHMIKRAMERGGMGRFEDVERDVLTNNSYLWLAMEGSSLLASAVTKVTTEADHRLCTIIACCGHDWERWGGLIAGLEKYARAEGCGRIEICGRPGWVKRLPSYRTVKVVIRKEL